MQAYKYLERGLRVSGSEVLKSRPDAAQAYGRKDALNQFNRQAVIDLQKSAPAAGYKVVIGLAGSDANEPHTEYNQQPNSSPAQVNLNLSVCINTYGLGNSGEVFDLLLSSQQHFLYLCLYVCRSVCLLLSLCITNSQLGTQSTRKLSYPKDDRAMLPIYGCPEDFRESLSTPTATFPEIFNGRFFRSIL